MLARAKFFVLLMFFCGLAVSSAHAIESSHVVLQALDKITARVYSLVVARDEVVDFGDLQIAMRHCDYAPPTEPPRSVALLEIGKDLGSARPQRFFFGWMFASSPSVNPLQHPVYDIWVLECKDL